ncbi:DUF393 domain-containing protein [Saccharopolyspora sp. HNM0983]|uniref:DUF393 domain-containing protein n=1 Tax=Saccharopolyspora montiporae TaxID=2781240 RepID=A0A929BCV5_9PSEU|nr:DUF393 domain-containing protein [Saccharopolyspora sp. HNM0983]
MPDRPLLVYDGDCGFCTRSVFLARRLPARSGWAARPWQELDLAALRTTVDRARHEVLWIDADGRIFGGAAAAARLLRATSAPWSWLGALLTAPVLSSIAEWAYRRIANNRHRLPGTTPACSLPAEQRPAQHPW